MCIVLNFERTQTCKKRLEPAAEFQSKTNMPIAFWYLAGHVAKIQNRMQYNPYQMLQLSHAIYTNVQDCRRYVKQIIK